MAFLESDRVQVRRWTGYPQIWLQADPRLENAIQNIQSSAEGGTRPDGPPSSAEVLAKQLVRTLQTIEQQVLNLGSLMGGTTVGKIQVDVAREQARLYALGREYISQLCAIFDTEPGPAAPFNAGAEAGNAGGRGVGLPPGPFGGRQGY